MTRVSASARPSARTVVLAALGAAVLLAGCAAQRPAPEPVESLDERTGATLTRVPVPVVFHAEDRALAANVRDYLYLAPVTVNRSGTVTRWLWIATWSSIDRGARVGVTVPADLSGLQLVVDGEPMELDFAAARADIDGLKDSPYGTPVETAVHRYVPVTASQLARIARARTLALHSEHGSAGGRDWQRWTGDGATLRIFAQLATDPAGPAVPVSAMRDR